MGEWPVSRSKSACLVEYALGVAEPLKTLTAFGVGFQCDELQAKAHILAVCGGQHFSDLGVEI
jgi:hypothetical protein